MKNLDQLSADYGFKLATKLQNKFGGNTEKEAKSTENLITKALGVLQQQGIYAFSLFCISRTSREDGAGQEMKTIITELLTHDELGLIVKQNEKDLDLLKEIRKDNGLASNLDNLILANEIVEMTLIYGRYHAKALGNNVKKETKKKGD